ncbi:uncharacterized protein [Triticum aestivum]|uniref:uncharacterized protein n=1 Tax=Triticum aestivum TaxID=4565 RepID=UPI001D009985|nr:uncharacterized protein LOC123096761 [Triticum aestivum]
MATHMVEGLPRVRVSKLVNIADVIVVVGEAKLVEAKAQIPLLTTPPALPLLFPRSPAPPPNVPTKHHPSATATASLSLSTRARAASPSAPSPSPSPPADGVGPAAPTRGDVYLGRQLAAAAAAGARTRAPEEDVERRRRRKEKRRALAKKMTPTHTLPLPSSSPGMQAAARKGAAAAAAASASFHSTAAALSKSTPRIRFNVREKRTDAKNALKNILLTRAWTNMTQCVSFCLSSLSAVKIRCQITPDG